MNTEKLLAHYQQQLSDSQYREALAITALSDLEERAATMQERLDFLEEQNDLMKSAIEQSGGTVTEFTPGQGELPQA